MLNTGRGGLSLPVLFHGKEKKMEELKEIRIRLIEIAEQEATRLYRMARKLQEHGGSPATVAEIREEANYMWTNMTGYPERLLDTETKWKYAFK